MDILIEDKGYPNWFLKLRKTIFYRAIRYIYIALRALPFRIAGGTRYRHRFYHPTLIKALGGFLKKSDIIDHLNSIFFFTLSVKPKLIVELGTRGGESTRVLLAAASICNARVLSIDIHEYGKLNLPFREHWEFYKSDDIEFGKTGFPAWCAKTGIEAMVDVLFIDTSHFYDHTKEEIAVWSKYLRENGIIMFHDTNMGKGVYSRLDGSCGLGIDNKRGVIKAIEERFGQKYDEKAIFSDFRDGFVVMHYPFCSGLTILKKCSL